MRVTLLKYRENGKTRYWHESLNMRTAKTLATAMSEEGIKSKIIVLEISPKELLTASYDEFPFWRLKHPA
jgi:hypothetical protein